MTFSDEVFAGALKVFVCFDSLRPSQQFFSHVSMSLPGLNQYLAEDNVSNLRTQCSAPSGFKG